MALEKAVYEGTSAAFAFGTSYMDDIELVNIACLYS